LELLKLFFIHEQALDAVTNDAAPESQGVGDFEVTLPD